MTAFRRTRLTGQRIRVLVVDDSVVIRRLVTHALEDDRDIEIAGTASNGAIALARIPQLNPDVLTLDVEMPEMDGLETLRRIRRDFRDLRVVMFSTMTERGADITFEALALGADDYVTKASNEGSLDQSLHRLREDLIPKIKQFFTLPASAPLPVSHLRKPVRLPPAASAAVVGIGVSTGGPTALAALLPQIPADFPLPILIVQHMPPMFTRLLAERLDHTCPLRVHEARDGDLVEPGHIFIAPGDFHMRVERKPEGVRLRLDQGPQLNSCRPAVDALFLSMAEVYGGAVTAVILTGMGRDGCRGAEVLKSHGAWLIAQDEASSVVWGMPGAVTAAGLPDRILPLGEIPAAIAQEAACPR
ncbi:MAG TPA: chemotaxis response regulator protein-glutamate methylesterase [Bryobacteraceae bacterium]|nr:chemotaxis response regulator protein-glutamate methylesterase [Bryobacteraceae bacterium]